MDALPGPRRWLETLLREERAEFCLFLEMANLMPVMKLGDFGAGTGNFSTLAARMVPGLRVVHVDADPGMNEVARQKARSDAWEIREENLEELQIEPGKLDAVVSVHAL